MYIAIEGIDGSGKSTQIEMLKQKKFPNTLFVREPYYFSPEIKKLLLNQKYANPAAHTLLFLASHAELYTKYLNQTDKSNIISDRSLYSTLAYTYGYNYDLAKKTKNILRMLNMEKYPDIVIYLQCSILDMQERLKGKIKDNIEKKSINYFKRILTSYHNLIRDSTSKWYVINAMEPAEQIHTKIMDILIKEKLCPS